MRGSYLIVLIVYTKQLKKVLWATKSTKNQNMKESSIVVTSVNTKLCTSRLLGFINIQNTGISKFECEQCEYKATKKGHLRVHTLSKHGGIFDCDQCECKATIKNHLRVHTLSKRKGIRFDCDQCEYKARQKKSTNSAQAIWTWFDCDQSEYKANHKDSLRLH